MGVLQSMLFDAVKKNDCKKVEQLIKYGKVDLNDPPNMLFNLQFYGETPLGCACIRGYTDMARLLLINGAKVNCSDSATLSSPLHDACGSKVENTELVELLLEYGAEVNDIDENGRTALHVAVINNHFHRITTILLKNGGKSDSIDQYGRTPLSYAIEEGSKECIAAVLSFYRMYLYNGLNPDIVLRDAYDDRTYDGGHYSEKDTPDYVLFKDMVVISRALCVTALLQDSAVYCNVETTYDLIQILLNEQI